MIDSTGEQTSVDWLGLEYVETEAGDVYAQALVTRSGEIERIVDVDTGCDVVLEPAELVRVMGLARARRENAARRDHVNARRPPCPS